MAEMQLLICEQSVYLDCNVRCPMIVVLNVKYKVRIGGLPYVRPPCGGT